MDFSGTWDVVSSPDFAWENLVGGRFTLRQNGEFVKGEYEIQTMYGAINGGVHSDFIEFDFVGNDEWEEVSGEGEATLEDELLTFELRYHHGDEWTYRCKRRE